MAIDRIPGVGPANTDIANAVAAVVPTNASIAAAVPTNTSIANAVAAAVPTNTSIANAVAAAVPTNTSIANAVAAAVPTNTSITNIVQTYSAGPTTFNRVAILTNSQTWNHPDGATANNARRVQVLVLGGGGGGGGGWASSANGGLSNGAGGGGGGSGYANFVTTMVTGSVTVTVGAGGTGGSGGTTGAGSVSWGFDGNSGGVSAFGNITSGGGFYGLSNRNPGTGGGIHNGVDMSSYSTQTFWYQDSTSNLARYKGARGGSGGGYAWSVTYSSIGSWSQNGNYWAANTTPSYPLQATNGYRAPAFGGSFGNRAVGFMETSNGLTAPAVYADRTLFMGSSVTNANVFNADFSHPYTNVGNGINTRIDYQYATTSASSVGVFANIQDVPTDLGSIQSGGGTAGYSPAGNTTNANAVPGGRGLLGNGGSGGTSATQVYNYSAGANISAGSGGAAQGYGGGGGGGSSAGTNSNSVGTITAGNGGAGGAGVVVVFY
jgi:hypothetical protein